ncbi:alpha/beta fold hydrolase [Streptomyces sp. bgisy022]|uniref:alpha/beta fold hydrolase n=1 Tax=Streptomyces sp. bgisy022 TaxID=3413769 RepID=UPI003D706384
MLDSTGTPPTLSFQTSDGALAYVDQGSGPPLVFLHGGFVDHTMWDAQIPVFARTHRVIAPDARGHGASANATRPFRSADDLAALLRHLDAAPAILVGLSMGGGVAVDTVLEHPELVRAVVVSGSGTSEPVFEDPWTLDVSGAQQRALAAGDVEGWLAAFDRFTVGPRRTVDDVDPDVVRRLRAMALRTIAKHTADEPPHHVPVRHTWERAKDIRVPVFAINGAADSPDILRMAERLVTGVRAPGGRVKTVGGGHYPNMEDPDGFNAALTTFLNRLDAPEAPEALDAKGTQGARGAQGSGRARGSL